MNLPELQAEVEKLNEEKGWDDSVFALSIIVCMLYQQGRMQDWEFALKHLDYQLGMTGSTEDDCA